MDARCERSPGKPTNYPMTNDSSHPGGYGGIEHSLVSIIILFSKALGSTMKTFSAQPVNPRGGLLHACIDF